jgi:pyruvate ferredoxin oxidoreductase alpha subunit
LFAETNQEALDLHIQAFKLAEEVSLPVMVCMDGFILTHAYERVDVPTQEQVDAFLPPYEPRQVLDPKEPVSIGAMVGPEAFSEVRYLAHAKQMQALELIPKLAEQFKTVFGRDSGGLTHSYLTDDAETIVVAMGSVLGTIKDTVDEMRAAGEKIGVLGITSYRPFPIDSVRAALQNAQRVVVLEKSLAVGIGGILSTDVRMAMSGLQLHGHTVVAGLGGRAITRKSLRAVCQGRSRRTRAPDLPRSRLERGQQAARTRAHDAPFGSGSRKHAARRRRRCRPYWLRRTTMSFQPVHFYQTGTFTVGNRLLAEEERSVQANIERTNSLNSGHRACQGCGEALGARYAIDAAMNAAVAA